MFFGSRLNRLATSIRRGISKYSVGSDNPGLVFDFIDNFYQKDKNQTVNFDGAITHARSGNAVMTDGYGPELVTVSSFSVIRPSANGLSESQTLAQVESGKVYVMTYLVLEEIGSSNTRVNNSGANRTILSGDASDSEGLHTVIFKANVSGDLTWACDNTGAFASLESVSVREMPVLKWAPHNLLQYSEQFDLWAGQTNVSVTPNAETSPDGTQTADALVYSATNGIIQRTVQNLVVGASYTFSVWLKADSNVTARIGGFVSGFTDAVTVNVTTEWQQFYVEASVVQTSRYPQIRSDGADTIYVWGAHVYRSDLGGMADNPDRGDSYVPTTSSAEYLPRIGHHVYNGSAWVNEGLLAESEERVNTLSYSHDFSQWTPSNASVSSGIIGPDGQSSAYTLSEGTNTSSHYIKLISADTSATWTGSVYIKKKDAGRYVQLRPLGLGAVASADFNPEDGSLYQSRDSNLIDTFSEDIGNGWYRVGISCDLSLSNASSDGFVIVITDGTNADLPNYTGTDLGVYIYGAQIETGSTPSSLIPTSGSSVTRAAESFTIPSANLPWPEPNYIGSELVDATSVTAGSGWTVTDADTVSAASIASTYLAETESIASGLVDGNVYFASVEVTIAGSGTTAGFSTSGGLPTTARSFTNGTATIETPFVYDASTLDGNIRLFKSGTNNAVTFDNISVREINPLSVSIGMEGRMTYADEDALGVITFWDWKLSNSDNLSTNFDTRGSDTGQPYITMKTNNNGNIIVGPSQAYAPDIFVPFNISARYGSTFINGGVDGSLMNTAINHTDGLPDLSSTDLNLAYDYMGTISEFRVWDKDLGDAGIVEATNPSLEPSLSLTFEGTGTTSFTVSDWSE